jgi:sugar phosphate isomerase/epimerase
MSRVGVCSWSLGVASIPELERVLPSLGTDLVSLGCGDPAHGSWIEGDGMPAAVRAAGIRVAGAMIAFDGEDFSSPVAIRRTGGFNPPATRAERLARVAWAVQRATEFGASELTLHIGHVPEPGDAERGAFVDALGRAAGQAREHGVTLCVETGSDAPAALAACLAEVGSPSLMVNFDAANLIAAGHDDPVAAVGILGPYIRGVHIKDALPPTVEDEWGTEMPVGHGAVPWPALLAALAAAGYGGPLCVEREGGTREERVIDVADAVAFVRALLAQGTEISPDTTIPAEQAR